MNRATQAILPLLYTVLAAASCGRTGFADSDGSLDDSAVRKSPPCQLGCQQICGAATSCGLLEQRDCSGRCAVRDGVTACIERLICEQTPSCGDVARCVNQPSTADLVVGSFSTTDGVGRLTYAVRVCNRGNAAAPPSAAQVYRDRPTPPSPVELGDLTLIVPALAVGACADRALADENLPPGRYRSYVQLDVEGQIPELDETNNVAGPSTAVVRNTPVRPAPNLRLSSFNATQDSPGLVHYTTTICNAGDAAMARAARLGIYLNRTAAPPAGATADIVEWFVALPPGQCTSVQHKTVLASGTYRSWAYADFDNVIEERSEGDNTAGPLTVSVAAGMPDLRVAKFTASGSGGALTYRATICNDGPAPSPRAVARVYLDRQFAPTLGLPSAHSTFVAPLAVGDCAPIALIANAPAGERRSWIYVDPDNQIAEKDETNNIAQFKLTAATPAPDLQFTDFRAISNASGGVFYSVSVCNRGSLASGPTSVAIHGNRTTPPPSGAGDLSLALAALTPGLCTTSGAFANIPNGNYSAWARLDPDDLVKESNENNNVVGPFKFFAGTALRCDKICNTLISPCATLPPAQLSACVAACSNQGAAALDCAEKAAATGQCNDILACIFAP